jgi:hypothetical protein
MEAEKQITPIIHVIYDKITGRIVHKHTSFNVLNNSYEKCSLMEIVGSISGDDITMRRVTDHDPNNLELIILNYEPTLSLADLIVDLHNKKVVQKPRIKLASDKQELEGNGKDSTKLSVDIVDDNNTIITAYNDIIKITTSRGKLSERGGLVQIKEGKGQLTLLSVQETVDRVKIKAECLRGGCQTAQMELSFI